MVLARMTWPEVEAASRDTVVVIPTGSLEQHGPHLPLFTDTLIVTAVAEAVEAAIPHQTLLTPTLWLGASAHHLPFPGTLSADFPGYQAAVTDTIRSLLGHGFWRFYVINGHGGNDAPNDVALRALKTRHPKAMFGHLRYDALIADVMADTLEGDLKTMRHGCEAETSLMLHLQPDLVHLDRAGQDGLTAEPPVQGLVTHFDEITVQGSFGDAPRGTAAKGARLFAAAVTKMTEEIAAIAAGIVWTG